MNGSLGAMSFRATNGSNDEGMKDGPKIWKRVVENISFDRSFFRVTIDALLTIVGRGYLETM